MKLSKTYLSKITKYLSSGYGKRGGLYKLDNNTVFAENGYSLIIFSIMGDEDYIRPEDFVGIDVKYGEPLVKNIWEHIVDPYMKYENTEYIKDTEEVLLSDLKEMCKNIRNELGLTPRTKLYPEHIDSYRRFGTMNINPELLYDVGDIVGRNSVEIHYPKDWRKPAVVFGRNTYGAHLGFVLGSVINV